MIAELAALGSSAALILTRHDVTAPSSDAEVDEAADALAEALREQWRPEAAKRGLVSADPAEVDWDSSRLPPAGVTVSRTTTASLGHTYEHAFLAEAFTYPDPSANGPAAELHGAALPKREWGAADAQRWLRQLARDLDDDDAGHLSW
ncbi:hypothetical protein ACFO3J_34940 [Streptomyces polygonati]|uniref:Uncharacterized protein n=1 Tax=Streptomyces polygonati TaxID=1617087 RepID=A0ABV8I086_9ACTN